MSQFVVFFGAHGAELIEAASIKEALKVAVAAHDDFDHITKLYPCIDDTFESVVRALNERCR